ncbi:MAG: hydrogenase maturation nickel metallochaperone HypA [Thermoanaerobaculales bacterium]|nr:hydrogenase maturation nickel metallochaperone HypA [Thermoanaerobaculales bacterium]
MSLSWFLFSLVTPPLAAALSWAFLRREKADPALVVVFNGIMPGSGLAAAGRPVIEVVLGVLMAQVSLFIARGPFLEYLGPIALIGAAWGLIYTEWSPLALQGLPKDSGRKLSPSNQGPNGASKPKAGPFDTVGGMARRATAEIESEVDEAYSVAVRCTECGADVEVPVLHHAALCSFCGSHHLVIGQDDILQVAIPEKVRSEKDLRETILDHLRYKHYLKLYKRSVAPLERQATQGSPTGGMTVRADIEAASAAAERAVSLKADFYRNKLSAGLEIVRSQHFFSPYRHAVGTLYQAAFGRDRRTQDKCLLFTMGTVETAITAQKSINLPEMGKLSYLKALIPAAQLADEVRTAPFNLAPEAIDSARGNLSRKQLNRTIQTIKLGSSFVEEARAVVWRPWWVAEVKAPGIHEELLVDSGSHSVAGPGRFVPTDLLVDLPPEARKTGASLRFQPMECPTCGYEFRYDIDAVLHFCTNCHRLFRAHEDGKQEVQYHHAVEVQSKDLDVIPFWVFPLRLRTGDEAEITDFMHLKDGIDGTFDQIGDNAAGGQDELWIPAIRCINMRLMATAFNRLFIHVRQNPPTIRRERFPLDDSVQPWPICLEEHEVRSFAALYLANVFGRRDIARVNIHQVQTWLFEGELQSRGLLTYVPIPRKVTESFRPYVGRYSGRALAAATGEG